jgi:murein DD-endopeptidase MepM/ murein hydrolase activator NlpD
MRVLCSSDRRRVLSRLSLALAAAAALSGCSSDASRFQTLFASVQPRQVDPMQTAAVVPPGVDATISTGSIGSRMANGVRTIMRPVVGVGQSITTAVTQPVVQPLPAPTLPAPKLTPVAAPTNIARQPLAAPVLSPVKAAAKPIIEPLYEPVAKPVITQTQTIAQTPATLPLQKPVVDGIATGSIAAAQPTPRGGWQSTGGTKIVMREGETVYNLSRRFGVPASEILRANGIEKAGSVRTGQELIIPTYQYANNAPVSAPDSNPDTAIAKGSRGTIYDIPANKIPAPMPRPGDQVAVLPTVPQPKARANLDTAATGSVAAQAPADLAAKAQAKAAPVDQPLAQGGSENDGRYKVTSGDSLYAIAKKTGVSVGQLRAANGLTDKSVLKIGQVLNLPTNAVSASNGSDGVDGTMTGTRTPRLAPSATDATTTASIPSGGKTAKKPEAPDTGSVSAKAGLRWPVQGKVVTGFRAEDEGKPNDGIDIDVPEGTPVKAAEGGTVIYAGSGLAEFGKTVLIRHDNGLVTVYGHADQLNVVKDQRINKGEVIALSGASGKTKKPKLHFEVRKNSVPVDPSQYLQ